MLGRSVISDTGALCQIGELALLVTGDGQTVSLTSGRSKTVLIGCRLLWNNAVYDIAVCEINLQE